MSGTVVTSSTSSSSSGASLSSLVKDKAFKNPGDLPWEEIPRNYCYFSDLTSEKSLLTLLYEAGGDIENDSRDKNKKHKHYSSKEWKEQESAFLSQIEEENLEIENPFGSLDLSRWSMIVSDKTLFNLSQVEREYKDQNKELKERGEHLKLKKPLLRLKIPKSKYISDKGLDALVKECTEIEELDISFAKGVTDIGLRSLAIGETTNLHKINISHISALRGEGLASIGNSCPNLLTLNMAYDNKIAPWSIAKLAYGCTNLQELNLAYCNQVNDETLKLISESCHDLRILNLEECDQTSDLGILSISHGCFLLESLNVSRSRLQFKITDICFLALGERCNMLLQLNADNCNHLTDVGLAWLAQGCKQLEDLSVAKCNKISNPGIRALSEECHRIKRLNINYLELLSDTAIKHIASGCPRLEELQAVGVYLISDGVDRAFGAEGICALSLGCCKLKKVNFSHCFRLTKLAFKNMAHGLLHLMDIDLSNCSKVSEEGLVKLFSGCKKFKKVNLSSCGLGVTDQVIKTLASSSGKKLTTLIILEAINLSNNGMKEIARYCKKMSHLEITNSPYLSDLGILPFCDGSFTECLTYLKLDECREVTDVCADWISDNLLGLLTLSLKGTMITKTYHGCTETKLDLL